MLLWVSLGLLVLIALFVLFGCSCRRFEGFETEELTAKERELFEDLKQNKLTDKEMGDLVKSGILNEKLINKFLTKIESESFKVHEVGTESAEGAESAPAPKKLPLPEIKKPATDDAAAAVDDKKAKVVEGFSVPASGKQRMGAPLA